LPELTENPARTTSVPEVGGLSKFRNSKLIFEGAAIGFAKTGVENRGAAL
jgi:hypothetical protein